MSALTLATESTYNCTAAANLYNYLINIYEYKTTKKHINYPKPYTTQSLKSLIKPRLPSYLFPTHSTHNYFLNELFGYQTLAESSDVS